jgi:hypothetical protein
MDYYQLIIQAGIFAFIFGVVFNAPINTKLAFLVLLSLGIGVSVGNWTDLPLAFQSAGAFFTVAVTSVSYLCGLASSVIGAGLVGIYFRAIATKLIQFRNKKF